VLSRVRSAPCRMHPPVLGHSASSRHRLIPRRISACIVESASVFDTQLELLRGSDVSRTLKATVLLLPRAQPNGDNGPLSR
jgi:hypothetical protein